MSRLLLKGGRVVDPRRKVDAVLDVLLADGLRSTIVDQVANGVSVRMAVLYLLLGGAEPAIGAEETA